MGLFQAEIPFFDQQFAYFGVAGCALLTLVVIVTGLGYRGKRQERYSVFNHFISELGEQGVSTRAPIFNGGLIISGLILVPFAVGLGLRLQNVWGILGAIAGVITAFACTAVGIFPMNNLSSHVIAAMAYFRAGLAMVVLFTLAILTQPPGEVGVPKWSVVFGALAILAYGSFLVLVRGGSALSQIDENLGSAVGADEANDAESHPPRPRFWALPAVEWGIFFSTIFWFLAIALVLV